MFKKNKPSKSKPNFPRQIKSVSIARSILFQHSLPCGQCGVAPSVKKTVFSLSFVNPVKPVKETVLAALSLTLTGFCLSRRLVRHSPKGDGGSLGEGGYGKKGQISAEQTQFTTAVK
jgi:hypothetical protein